MYYCDNEEKIIEKLLKQGKRVYFYTSPKRAKKLEDKFECCAIFNSFRGHLDFSAPLEDYMSNKVVNYLYLLHSLLSFVGMCTLEKKKFNIFDYGFVPHNSVFHEELPRKSTLIMGLEMVVPCKKMVVYGLQKKEQLKHERLF